MIFYLVLFSTVFCSWTSALVGCDSLYLLICLSNSGGGSFLCDLSPSIDLKRVVDFQFFKTFSLLWAFSNILRWDTRNWKSPLCPSSSTTTSASYHLYCRCFSRSFIYLGVKQLSHRVCIASNLLHSAKLISKVFIPICHPTRGKWEFLLLYTFPGQSSILRKV